jgi:hypothetical protein
MPQDVIDRVNTLGRRSHAANTLTFAWNDDTPVEDFDDTDDADDTSCQPSKGSDPQDDDNDDDLSNAGSHSKASVAGVDNDNGMDENKNESELDE